MKIFLAALLTLCIYGFCANAFAEPSCKKTLKEIRANQPCKPQSVEVVAYVNASRHGSWLSESVGSIKSGVPLIIDGPESDPSIKRLLNYVYQPKLYQSATFRASFHGMVQCGKNVKAPPSLRVHKVRNIVVSRIQG